jgi:hypothetical protein
LSSFLRAQGTGGSQEQAWIHHPIQRAGGCAARCEQNVGISRRWA